MALDTAITQRIRTLTGFPDAVYGEDGDQHLFDDAAIEAFYEEGFENVKCAAGLALIAIGSNQAFALKVIKNYETSTNGARMLREFREAGEVLYDKGLGEIALADEQEGIFEIVFPDYGARHPEGYTHGSYGLGAGW